MIYQLYTAEPRPDSLYIYIYMERAIFVDLVTLCRVRVERLSHQSLVNLGLEKGGGAYVWAIIEFFLLGNNMGNVKKLKIMQS